MGISRASFSLLLGFCWVSFCRDTTGGVVGVANKEAGLPIDGMIMSDTPFRYLSTMVLNSGEASFESKDRLGVFRGFAEQSGPNPVLKAALGLMVSSLTGWTIAQQVL
jgi:hypothetical protein